MRKKKKSGNKFEPASVVNLVTALINLLIALILAYENYIR